MPLSTSEVQAILKAEKADALSADEASKLSEERARAIDYYMGDVSKDMPAQKDRSQAVSYDVMDTVEGLMPPLVEIFVGGEDVVEFVPFGPEDEQQALQETDYINHVFMQKNPGFLIFYTFIKDALLSKNAVVKVYWEEKEEETQETYWGLDDAAYGMLLMDKRLTVIEHTERQGIPGQQPSDDYQEAA
jgi:hypothetical protein